MSEKMSIVDQAKQRMAKEFKINFNDPEVETRIREEVMPVIKAISLLMDKLSSALTQEISGAQIVALREEIESFFDTQGCLTLYESQPRHTAAGNAASLQWLSDAKQMALFIHPDYKTPPTESEKQELYFREMVHELGLLLLMKQLSEKLPNLPLNGSNLATLKNLLYFDAKNPNYAYTHVIDIVFQLIIRKKKQK